MDNKAIEDLNEVTKELEKASKKALKRAKQVRIREVPYAQVKINKPQSSKVIMGMSKVLTMLVLGYVATKLGDTGIE